MHDLAGHLGMPVGVLARTMPEPEFHAWQRYAARRMLPQRRIELMLAQIALLVARTGGDRDSTLESFLFDPPDDAPEGEASAEDAAEFFDFKPIRR